MSDTTTKSQDNSDQNQDQKAQTSDDTNQQQGDDTSQKAQSDKEKNFEAVRKQIAEKDRIIAEYKQKEADAAKKKLEEEGNFKQLLETEKKEKEEIQTKYQTEKRQLILEKELSKSGINSELVDMILPSVLSKIKFDDSNSPQNLEEVVESLKTSKPSLFVTTTTAGKVGAAVATSGSVTTDKDPSEMSITEFAQYRSKNI